MQLHDHLQPAGLESIDLQLFQTADIADDQAHEFGCNGAGSCSNYIIRHQGVDRLFRCDGQNKSAVAPRHKWEGSDRLDSADRSDAKKNITLLNRPPCAT
jgi:hypothetical protein